MFCPIRSRRSLTVGAVAVACTLLASACTVGGQDEQGAPSLASVYEQYASDTESVPDRLALRDTPEPSSESGIQRGSELDSHPELESETHSKDTPPSDPDPDPVTDNTRRSDGEYHQALAAAELALVADGARLEAFTVIKSMPAQELVAWGDDACDFIEQNEFTGLNRTMAILIDHWETTDQEVFGTVGTFTSFVTVTATARCPGMVDELVRVLGIS